MASNDFLPYAVGGGANVLSQASYAALTTLLANGLTSGIVPSDQLNKTLRQPTIMAAVLGQLIVDAAGQNAVDDGTIATLEKNLARVIRGDAAYAVDTGVANAYSITLAPAPLTYTNGMSICFVADNANTGASTLNVNGLGVKSITKNGTTALAAGDIPAGALISAKYDGTRFQIANPAILPATSSVIGVSRFGSNAEQLAGLLGTVGLTPAGLASGFSNVGKWHKWPGGFIEQWGNVTITAGANTLQTVVLPITYPNGSLGVWGTSGSVNSYAGAREKDSSSIEVFANNNGALVYWRSVGW